MTMTARVEAAKLAELVKEVQAGNEVLLTLGDKTVAKLVAASVPERGATGLRIRSLKGHQVLIPVVSQEELAGEMFDRK